MGALLDYAAGARPGVLPIFINDNAATAESANVTLTLTSEQVSNIGSINQITGIQISENPSFAGATWQPWSQTIPFELSAGHGSKTVYIKFTDGTTQVISTATIVVNTSPFQIVKDELTFLLDAETGQLVPDTHKLSLNSPGSEIAWSATHSDWIILSQQQGLTPAAVEVSISNIDQLLANNSVLNGEISFASGLSGRNSKT